MKKKYKKPTTIGFSVSQETKDQFKSTATLLSCSDSELFLRMFNDWLEYKKLKGFDRMFG